MVDKIFDAIVLKLSRKKRKQRKYSRNNMIYSFTQRPLKLLVLLSGGKYGNCQKRVQQDEKEEISGFGNG